MTQSRPAEPSAVGKLLQFWRTTRHMSQLALASEADVSPRHICFLETGRARPSREMVLLLSRVLDVPLRERNALLLAAGYAPVYRAADLRDEGLRPVRRALDAILKKQEPYPAVVMNRHWDVLFTNRAAARFFGFLLGPAQASEPANVIRMMFHPRGLRAFVRNWEAVAEELIKRVHREALAGVPDGTTRDLLDDVLRYPDVPRHLSRPDLATAMLPVIPIAFAHRDLCFNYFTTVTTLGTPQDITLQEIRIECFYPNDDQTDQNARALADLAEVQAAAPAETLSAR